MRRTLSATLVSVLALAAAGSEVFRGFQAHLADAAQFRTESGIARFELPSSGLTLGRASKAGAFLDVVGRRSAFLGYEHRGLEAWVYPLKLFDDLQVAFTLAGYPLEVAGRDVLTHIEARPESTVLTYSHAAFTVRQVLAAPIDEPALVMLLDVETTLPLGIRISFRPRLRLMWPAGLQTGNIRWNEPGRFYELTEDSGRFAGVVGSPAARTGSLMPYQEEPRDVPVQFDVDPGAVNHEDSVVPIVIAASVTGIAEARATYARVLGTIPELLSQTAAHYRALLTDTLQVDSPDERLDAAFAWAKVGIDKGVASNPLLGTGLLAGFGPSGDSERPGFAWYFGRDAIWTTFATTSTGSVDTTRIALEFLRRYQREDGKVPHEVSQSAALIPWFTAYPYAWASADATPLFIVGHADYWQATGDAKFIRAAWPSLVQAFRFSAATDSDGNGLIENTKVGHGWVEGGALYPPHEEIYLQGVWIAALDGLTQLATHVMSDAAAAAEASRLRQRAAEALERIYWLPQRGGYAYATKLPRAERVIAEPGPARERRQQRLDAIDGARLYDEQTVLTSIPMWWRLLDPARADAEIDSLGSGALATDWGHRILANTSELYDPLSYHSGSVWPLFTGWASLGAYRYGRPHVGWQALMANALLTDAYALGYITELLSGDFQAPFGRSSPHQVWSEAMVVTPLVRGLLGLDVTRTAKDGAVLTVAPQLPADWRDLTIRNIVVGGGEALTRFDVRVQQIPGLRVFEVTRRGAPIRLTISAALPLDARVRQVTVNGRRVSTRERTVGDVRFVDVPVDGDSERVDVRFRVHDGTSVYRPISPVPAGASNDGLRILRARADASGLLLRLEGRAGRRYPIRIRTSRPLGRLPDGVRRIENTSGDAALEIAFEGSGDYVRRDITVPLGSP